MSDRRPPDGKPSVWALYARRMRKEREKRGMKQEEVAHALTVSLSVYGHYECCRRVPPLRVSESLDKLYDTDALFAEMHELVLEELQLPSAFLVYTEQEEQASTIRIYHPLFMPGLVQSKGYATEILAAGQPAERLEQLVTNRLGRQDILDREEPPWLFIAISETVVRAKVGSSVIMREQLTRLLDLMRRPRVSIQVVPDDAPVYVSGPFTVLSYPEGADLGYLEAACGNERVMEIPERVHQLGLKFSQIQTVALNADDSEKLIRRALESL
jgi:transcriptional regulator with XRE-family HTH domain